MNMGGLHFCVSQVEKTAGRMHSNNILRSLLLAVCLMACQEIYAADAAKDAAASFYQNYHKLRAGGLTGIPNETQLAQLSPLITPQLQKLFGAAYLEQQRCMKQYPDDKPPWIEGDIFSSNFEGFTSFTVASSKVRGQTRQVPVKFVYIEGKFKVKWTDTLVLRYEAGHWLVDDIFYHANFAFTSGFGKNLQSSLKSIPAC